MAPEERKLGRIAAALLGGSMVALGLMFVALFGLATGSSRAMALIAAGVLFVAHVWVLANIDRYAAHTRLRIWWVSFAVHVVVIVAVMSALGVGLGLVVLMPEAASAVLHVFGIAYASRKPIHA
jgi:hypothetical protein